MMKMPNRQKATVFPGLILVLSLCAAPLAAQSSTPGEPNYSVIIEASDRIRYPQADEILNPVAAPLPPPEPAASANNPPGATGRSQPRDLEEIPGPLVQGWYLSPGYFSAQADALAFAHDLIARISREPGEAVFLSPRAGNVYVVLGPVTPGRLGALRQALSDLDLGPLSLRRE